VVTQLYLHDIHDAKWIEDAKNRGLDCAEFSHFLREYSLRRGGLAALANDTSMATRVLHRLHNTFRNSSNDPSSLSETWLLSVKENSQDLGCRAYSMCSKLLWFYRPLAFTMYDSKAISGLAAVWGNRPRPEGFIAMFEEKFEENMAIIAKVTELVPRRYPYARRVFDKWLWLKGDPNGCRVIDRFRVSISQLPLDRD
jgi:hypothetical protein